MKHEKNLFLFVKRKSTSTFYSFKQLYAEFKIFLALQFHRRNQKELILRNIEKIQTGRVQNGVFPHKEIRVEQYKFIKRFDYLKIYVLLNHTQFSTCGTLLPMISRLDVEIFKLLVTTHSFLVLKQIGRKHQLRRNSIRLLLNRSISNKFAEKQSYNWTCLIEIHLCRENDERYAKQGYEIRSFQTLTS